MWGNGGDVFFNIGEWRGCGQHGVVYRGRHKYSKYLGSIDIEYFSYLIWVAATHNYKVNGYKLLNILHKP